MRKLRHAIPWWLWVLVTIAAGTLFLRSAWADSRWPDHRGDLAGVSAGGGTDVQIFAAGPGTYTWTKPTSAQLVDVWVFSPGGGGGSGGAGTSIYGGGGGASGAMFWGTFFGSALNATETVVLGFGGTGGLGVAGNTNGNPGSDATETSFGAAARNLLRLDPLNTSGSGGSGADGLGGSGTISGFTARVGSLYKDVIAGSNGGGAGDGTTSTGCTVGTLQLEYGFAPPCPGSGGGGSSGGARNGGATGSQGTLVGFASRGGGTQGAAPEGPAEMGPTAGATSRSRSAALGWRRYWSHSPAARVEREEPEPPGPALPADAVAMVETAAAGVAAAAPRLQDVSGAGGTGGAGCVVIIAR